MPFILLLLGFEHFRRIIQTKAVDICREGNQHCHLLFGHLVKSDKSDLTPYFVTVSDIFWAHCIACSKALSVVIIINQKQREKAAKYQIFLNLKGLDERL